MPALLLGLYYKNSPIHNGDLANKTHLRMINGRVKGGVSEARNYLLDYCKIDTLTRFKIWKVLCKWNL